MLPVLLDLRFIKIYTFGIFLVLAFFWGCFLLWSNIRLSSYKEEHVFDGVFFSMGGALLTGRLVYVVLHFDKFGFDIAKFILINGYPGLSLYGAVTGGLLVFYAYSVLNKMKFSNVIDYAVAPILLAVAIGKLGSFFSGGEAGTRTVFPLSVKYVGYEGLRHLTPFYESLLFFFGAYVANRLLFAIRRERFGEGFTLMFFFWYFSLVSFIIDPLRAEKVSILNIPFNRTLSAIILLTITLYFIYYFRSQFFKRMRSIISSPFRYGRKTHKTVHHGSTKEAGGGEKKDSEAN